MIRPAGCASGTVERLNHANANVGRAGPDEVSTPQASQATMTHLCYLYVASTICLRARAPTSMRSRR